MKSLTVGLETDIDLTEGEIEILRDYPLVDKTKYFERGLRVGDILIELIHRPSQTDGLMVRTTPLDVHFSKAEHIQFSINGDSYEELRRIGEVYCGRFYGGSGRLEIHKVDY